MGLRKQKTLIEKAQIVAGQKRPQVEAALGQAAQKASEGLKHAAPLIEQGKVKAGVTLAHVADMAAEAAESAQHFVEEKSAELRHEEPPKKSKGGKLKKLLLVSGLLAVVGVVAKKLTEKKESARWQDTRPTPAPTPTSSSTSASTGSPATTPPPATTAPKTDDNAGASPDEALSDSVDEPHAVTTPDEPAEVVHVSETPTDKPDDPTAEPGIRV